MLHLNAKLRERHGFFSRQTIQSLLRDPELYVVDTIEEIKLHRLKRTQNKIFSPGKNLLDKSVIFLSSCSLELMNEAIEESASRTDDTPMASFIRTVPNAFVSDNSGKLPLLCQFKVDTEIVLENILIFYYHRLGIYRLEHAEQMPTKNKMTRMVLARIINLKESFSPTSTDN